ncbi:hypothetical protein ACGFJ7_21115 [Actinoplanes sp. NPDC048988]|uniref:hypothetical protein n=1 Tax=Actinoplanes sp. NPDC048988 TaxID=3363901 RepID=UPI0037150B05
MRNEARSASVAAALAALDDLEAEEHDVSAAVIETMRGQLQARLSRYRDRIDLLRDNEDSIGPPVSPQYEAALHVRRVALDARRDEFLRWRDAG